jgi:hypothetical protein
MLLCTIAKIQPNIKALALIFGCRPEGSAADRPWSFLVREKLDSLIFIHCTPILSIFRQFFNGPLRNPPQKRFIHALLQELRRSQADRVGRSTGNITSW